MLDALRKYFASTPEEEIEKNWAATAEYDEVGITVAEFWTAQIPGKTGRDNKQKLFDKNNKL